MKCFVVALAGMLVTGCAMQSPVDAGRTHSTDAQVGSTAPAFVRDPHSYSRPEEIAIEHITLDLTVNFAKKQLNGSATLRVKHHRPDANQLILDTQGLSISRVTLLPGGVPAQYQLGKIDPTFGQKLEITMPPDTQAVAISYITSPDAKALQWLEPAMTAGKRFPFLLSQSQTILARSWVPLQDTPQVRFTYDATIRVPRELLALMSAENPQQKAADGVYRFRMQQAVPSYLLAIAVGDLTFRSFDQRSGVYAEKWSCVR